jgi:hypothetical protein
VVGDYAVVADSTPAAVADSTAVAVVVDIARERSSSRRGPTTWEGQTWEGRTGRTLKK